MALATHRELTIKQLVSILELERTHITKHLAWLRKWEIVASYESARVSRPRSSHKLFWKLDIRHPQRKKIRALGKTLAKAFPLPGPCPFEPPSRHRWATRSIRSLDSTQIKFLGAGPQARIIMFLSHANNVPIETISKLLGLSRGTIGTVNTLIRWGVLKGERVRNQHRISLNKAFCSYSSLRRIARAIDKAGGRESLALARSRVILLDRERCVVVNAERAARRTAGKPYHNSPTGFAVTGQTQNSKFWKKHNRPIAGPTPNPDDGGRADD
jgi:hypothetical protein